MIKDIFVFILACIIGTSCSNKTKRVNTNFNETHANKYIKPSKMSFASLGTFSNNIEFGSVFRSDMQSISLPYSFIDTNYVVTLQGIAPVHVCYAVDDDKSVNLFKFYSVGFVSQASVSSRIIEYMCIGKWK